MTFSHIKEIIPKAIQKYGLARECTASHVCHLYLRIAPDVIHHRILDHSFPKHFKEGTLVIGVMNPIWIQEIQLKKHILQKRLNEALKKSLIKNIRMVVAEKKQPYETGPQ